MPKVIERQSGRSEAYSRMYPHVIGGVCEYCGIVDNKYPSTEQYKLCQHFKGMGELMCSYCPDNANPQDVIYRSDLKVHEHPENPNKIVVVCDSYECSQKHLRRFKLN